MYASAEIEQRRREEGRKGLTPLPPTPPYEAVDYDPYKRSIALIEELASEAVCFARRRPRARTRGRPSGFRLLGPGSLQVFTLRILWDVRATGGRLTLDKNNGRGTLVEALVLLRPYLPPGFVPIVLPLSSFGRLKVLDKKIAVDAELTDNFLS